MGKSIEELTEDYMHSTLAGSSYIKRCAFKAGANAVCDEFDNLLKEFITDDINEISENHMLHLADVLIDKIKELRQI